MRLYLDSNIFIYAFEGRRTDVMKLFVDTDPSRGRLFTSVLTKSELLVKPLRERDDRLAETYESWLVTNDILEVGEIDGAVARYAAVLRAQYRFLKLPDAIHLSTAAGFGCTHFVSFDGELSKVSEISHVRWGIERAQKMPTFLSPDDPSFERVIEELAA